VRGIPAIGWNNVNILSPLYACQNQLASPFSWKARPCKALLAQKGPHLAKDVILVPPRLFLQNAGTALQLIYATNYTGYVVQSSPALSPVAWAAFSTGTNMVALSPSNSSRFFRLSKP